MRSHAHDGTSDDDLYALAKKTLFEAASEPPKSIKRAVKFAAYDELVKELQRRMANHVARELGLPEEP